MILAKISYFSKSRSRVRQNFLWLMINLLILSKICLWSSVLIRGLQFFHNWISHSYILRNIKFIINKITSIPYRLDISNHQTKNHIDLWSVNWWFLGSWVFVKNRVVIMLLTYIPQILAIFPQIDFFHGKILFFFP